MSAHAVGGIVEAICGKCNDVMGHTIMAMVGGEIVKVECRACKSVHKYRPPVRGAAGRETQTLKRGRNGSPALSGQSAVAPKKTAARKVDTALDRQQAWQNAMRDHDPGTARPYAISEAFAVGEAMTHPVFGAGVVTALVPPDKMDVLFALGTKRLLCNRA